MVGEFRALRILEQARGNSRLKVSKLLKKMKDKKAKIIAYAIAPILGLSMLGTGVASAQGWFGGFGNNLTPDEIASKQTTMFQSEANVLGLSLDEVKNSWAQGKTILQLAQDHGITQDQLKEKMRAARLAELKTQLQVLVTKGVITQAQADSRISFVQSHPNEGWGMGMDKGLKMGMMKGAKKGK